MIAETREFCKPPRGGRIPAGAGGAIFNSDAATVSPTAYFFCCARKSRQKDALGRGLYCALTRAIFWPFRGLNALFGRKFATMPMVFGADKCTTRSYWQTTSASVLLISGILGRLRFCTACLYGPMPTSAHTNMYNRTQIFSTIGAYVDAFCIPRQRVLPSPCVATAIDGSVVSTQAAL